jgi:predicted transcriptional regulator YdeE
MIILIQSYVDITYSKLYVSDLQKAVKWYYRAFGFQLLSINPDFATLQIAPGRILFLDRDTNAQRSIGLKTGNILAIQSQLIQAQIEFVFPEDDNHTWFRLKDPDGNSIEVMPGVFGLEVLKYSLPDDFVSYILCRLESKEELHLIARKISDQSEFRAVSEELISLCQRYGMIIEGDAFTISRYTQQVDATYACVAVAEAPTDQLPDEIEYIQIPGQEYNIFSNYLSHENFRENHAWQHGWMDNCFSKADTIYILEYYDDEHIHTYFPYEWCRDKS